MVPQIENSNLNSLSLTTYPNKTYKFNEYQIAGKIDDLDAIEQSIFHILSIERYAYLIYDDNYGVELQKYIGQDLSYLEATIEDTLREALLQDDRIVDIRVTNITPQIIKQNRSSSLILNNRILTENINNVITEDTDYLTTEDNVVNIQHEQAILYIVTVNFDVYCKQGIIHTEVKVSV